MSYLIADSRRANHTGVDGITPLNFPTNKGDFIIDLKHPINRIIGIELLQCDIPPTPTVISGWNDAMLIYANAQESTITEDLAIEGYYTPDEFINMVNTELTSSASVAFTSTYNVNTNKYTIISAATARWLSGAEAYAAYVAGTITLTQYNSYIRFSALIGNNLGVATTLSASFAMPFETDLRGARYYTLQLELNGFGNQDITTSIDATSFFIPKNNDSLIAYSSLNQESNFRLVNEINNINSDHVHVKVFLEDDNKGIYSFDQDIHCLFRLHKRKSNTNNLNN